MRERLARWVFDRGVAIGLAALAIYLVLAPEHVVDGDNAEFSALSASGGVAHPSGYPLYILWLRLLSWLPGESPAHVANLATAILGGAAILVLHAACRAWSASAPAANLAIAIVAVGPMVLRMHSQAEAFALNNLVVATVIWLSGTGVPIRGGRRIAVLGLVAGLGLANHLTCVLVAPIGLVGVLRGARELEHRRWRALPIALGMAIVGLSPYLYLLIAPSTPMSWGAIDGFEGLVRHVLRQDYGGPGAFAGKDVDVSVLDNLGALAASLGRAWIYAPALIGLATMGWQIARPDSRDERIGWLAFATSWLLAGPLLVIRFDVPLNLLGTYVVQRFHLLPTLLLAIPVAVGFTALGAWLVRRRESLAIAPSRLAVIAIVAFGVLLVPTYRASRALRSPAMERGCINLLEALPPNALWFIGSDDLHFGTIYAQTALGIRPDVIAVTWAMMPMPWYRERIAARDAVLELERGAVPTSLRTALANLRAKRPVFIDDNQPRIGTSLYAYPYAGMYRVVAPDAPRPSLDTILDENKAAFAGFDLDYERPGPHDEYATVMHVRYAQTWARLAAALEKAGRPDDSKAALEIAEQLAPR